MKNLFSCDIFTLNIVFGSLLFQFNSAGSGETLDVKANKNLFFLNVLIFILLSYEQKNKFLFPYIQFRPLRVPKKSIWHQVI